MSEGFLVVNRQDMQKKGWDCLDFLFVNGDAYIDHPSFGAAVICRVLEARGYKVGLICQPDWRSLKDFKQLGKPRLGMLVSAGNLDSMLNKYTAAKKKRSKDAYSPGGQIDRRPDRATIVYCNRLRELWKDVPLICGGIEASLRRFTHYDYWADDLRRSILLDSKADLLVYGMGERQITQIADCLAGGVPVSAIRHIDGTAFLQNDLSFLSEKYVTLPSHEEITVNKELFAEAFRLQYQEQDPVRGNIVVQKSQEQFVVQRKPVAPLNTKEMDAVYDLPYMRSWHPSYNIYGGVPALAEVECGIISHRGCFGSCAFCAIHSHQGRIIQQRSHQSIVREAEIITKLPAFKGYINDVGGPTANFRQPACARQLKEGACADRQCMHPSLCPNLLTDHSDYIALLRKVRAVKGVKKVFIRSGVRYDYVLADKKNDFLRELCQYHVSGQLKIAPEHVNSRVLNIMGKPGKDKFLAFVRAYDNTNAKLDKKQYLVPYFISSHPGCTIQDAVELAEFIRDTGHYPEQVQDFIPTPGSAATAMYYAEKHPFNGKKLFVAKNPYEKAMQRVLLQYKNPKNRELVLAALEKSGRLDLVGFDKKCLLKPNKKLKRGVSVKYEGRIGKPRLS